MKRHIIKLVFVLTILGFTATNIFAQEMIQIKGSDTLINLVQKLSEVYMEKHPGEYIAVTGGGSGTGIAALINGQCDIANASRDIKEKEVAQARERNVDPKSVVIAIDGLSVIVNKSNKTDKLTVGQIGQIFRGEIRNWKDVGGQDSPITLYGRQSNSGTYIFFMEEVLKGDYYNKMNHMNGNAQIVEGVKRDATGIGYVGVGYVKEVKGINILKVASTPNGYYSSPLNTQDVKSGKYPISRTLNQYVNGSPRGKVKAFIDFELSAEGQKIVEEEGFFSVSK